MKYFRENVDDKVEKIETDDVKTNLSDIEKMLTEQQRMFQLYLQERLENAD